MALYFIYTPCETEAEAKKIATELLAQKLVACCNILPKTLSLYNWEGETKESQEALLIAKTSAQNKEKAIFAIEKIHSYDIPAIIAFPVESNLSYENWVNSSIG